MHKALHPRDDIDGFACIEDSVDASIRELEDNIKKSKEKLGAEPNNSFGKISTDKYNKK